MCALYIYLLINQKDWITFCMTILQNILFSTGNGFSDILCCRTSGTVICNNYSAHMGRASVITTDTYFNFFDSSTWNRYTGCSQISLNIRIKGKALISIYDESNSCLQTFDVDSAGTYDDVTINPDTGCAQGLYLKIEAADICDIERAFFYTANDSVAANDIELGIIICTYKRDEYIKHNLRQLYESEFFNTSSPLYGRMKICVVDNASELPLYDDNNICIIHNVNNGGAGGFTKGIEYFRTIPGITNVVFMDDDVEFVNETFYRLYSLLSLLKPEYADDVIQGRMFRLDNRSVQYTAGEIWNYGDIRHVGFDKDMSDRSCLKDMNTSYGEYAGWWLACYPVNFIKKNLPIPFFLHCDDVEYGIRCARRLIILNGINVWHETYEYRVTPTIIYYDIRNTLFVNHMHNMFDANLAIQSWKDRISYFHVQKEYKTEYMAIRAMNDFLKGEQWLMSVKPERLHRKLCRVRRLFRLHNTVFWRIVQLKYALKYNMREKHNDDTGAGNSTG